MSKNEFPIAKAHRQYRIKDGTIVPSVTTVLSILAKPGLIKWANDLGLQGIDSSKYVDAAGRVGTLIHYLVQCHLANEMPDLKDYTSNEIDMGETGLIKFLDWAKRAEPKPILLEAPLVSEKHRFGGTVDFYGVAHGKLTLVDFKSTKAIYDEMMHQVAAYRELLRENGYKVERVLILRIGRDDSEGAEPEEKPVDHLSERWQIFKHCLAIYNLQKQIKEVSI